MIEKSLGRIAKGGSTNLTEVYEYAQPVRARGLVFMGTPGYDPISVTGQVAGGANQICFTAGRGLAYGCAPSPSVKLATNTASGRHGPELREGLGHDRVRRSSVRQLQPQHTCTRQFVRGQVRSSVTRPDLLV